MKTMKKMSAVLCSAVLMLVLLYVPVSAQTSDMFLIAASETPYSQLVSAGSHYTLVVSPSNDYSTETGFDTEEDAEAVDWSVVTGSTTGISIEEVYADEMESGKYYSCADVYVSPFASAGCASIMAKTESGAYVNMTLILNRYTLNLGNVSYRVYTDSDFSKAPAKSGKFLTISSRAYAGTTNYANVADLTAKMDAQGVVDNCSIVASEMNGFTSYFMGSMDVDGVTYCAYTDENYNYYGWQYRVYDRNGNIVPLSEYVGVDDFELAYGQTVVWAYGTYTTVFPATLPSL